MPNSDADKPQGDDPKRDQEQRGRGRSGRRGRRSDQQEGRGDRDGIEDGGKEDERRGRGRGDREGGKEDGGKEDERGGRGRGDREGGKEDGGKEDGGKENGGKEDGGKEEQGRLKRWVAMFEQWAETVAKARRDGLNAADTAGEHADRATAERRRAEAVSPRNADVDAEVSKAQQASEAAAQGRKDAESSYAGLSELVDAFSKARQGFEAAVEQRDVKAAQAGVNAADPLVDQITDAVDPIQESRDDAESQADQTAAAANAAEAAAKQQGGQDDAEFSKWVKQFDLLAQAARADRDAAVADADAGELAVDSAADDGKRATQARPTDATVERDAAVAAEATKRALEAQKEWRESLRKLREHIAAFEAAKKAFDAAVEKRDREAGLAALDAAESAAGAINESRDEVAEQRQRAAEAAKEARDAADRAEAAAAALEDQENEDDKEQLEANKRAIERVQAGVKDLDGLLDGTETVPDEVGELFDAIDPLKKKGLRCAKRAGRSPVHGPVARAAMEEAEKHAELAEGVRDEIKAIIEQLRKAATETRDAGEKALQIYRADPSDAAVIELAEFVESGVEVLAELRERLKELIADLRKHLDELEAAVQRACDAARLARAEGTPPPGPDGVLWAPPPITTPTVDPSGLDVDLDESKPLVGEVPLLLVPVRIETRFGQPADGLTPLRIRIYPDRISVHDGLTVPTETEVEIAHEYWEQHHEADTEEGRAAAWSWFVDRLDIHRAGHLARLTRPEEQRGRLRWPEVETTDTEEAGEAVNLPGRFVAIGWSKGVQVFRVNGEKLDGKPYHTSPDPATDRVGETVHGITTTPYMRWMVDYDEAVTRGMAITIDVEQAWETIDTLIVVGVDRDPAEDQSQKFAALLETHSTSQGIAFVPQGTPTNNTDTVDAGWTRLQRERDVVAAQRSRDMSEKLDIGTQSNVSRFARALGISEPTQLARQPFALDTEWARGAAMRAGLYDIVIGLYLQELLPTGGSAVLTDPGHEELRQWFVDYVTGGAAVPTIRVASQPYAVLPVLRAGNNDIRPTIGHKVARVVKRLKDEWLRTLDDGVARLDHNVGENPESVRGNIADVLASEPHPADLFVRRLDLHKDTGSQFDEMMMGLLFDFQDGEINVVEGGQLTWIDIDNGFVREFTNDRGTVETDAPELWTELVTMRLELGAPQAVEDQIILWSKFQELVAAISRNPWGEGMALPYQMVNYVQTANDVLPVVNDIVAALVAHEQRQRPLSILRIPGFEGLLGSDNPDLIVSKFGAAATPVERPLITAPGFAPQDYLGPALDGNGLDDLEEAPLLAQLLHSAAAKRRLPTQMRGRALSALSDATEEELEWVLRETIGLGVHRLDAWHTAFANQELEAVRSRRPEGLYVGSYAWVTDLAIPEDAVERESRGFIHAPSMSHAATASVIRSAWHARGDADGRSPAAVDLRSNRYRYAAWLIEGVRAGQSLGDLLGYEFERLCHDLGIDEQIAAIRVLVGEAHGRSDGIEDPVDGIELMEMFDAGDLEDHLQIVKRDRGVERSETVRLLLEGIVWSFDAIDDALLAESTHHLLGGNFERAAASIEAGSGRATPPPTLTGMDTARPARTVNHKVVLLADAAAPSPSDWHAGMRDVIAPAMNALVASLLPRPQDVGLNIVDSNGGIHGFTLDALELSALDAVYLSSDDPTIVDAPLAEVIRLSMGVDGVVNPSLAGNGASVTFEEFQLVAVSVRRVLSESRVASHDDLDPALVGSTIDTAATANPDDVLGALVTEFETPVPLVDLRRRRLALAGFVGADDLEVVAQRRLHAARSLEGSSGKEVVGAFFGRPFPVVASISTESSGAEFDPSLADERAVSAWLDDVSLVRADVNRLVTTMNLSALVGVDAPLGAGSAQSPRHSGDTWAATGLPEAGTGGRNLVTAVWSGRTDRPPTDVVGLVIDQWSEQIPSDSTVTGVAMHYDAPSQRPPQAMILGVPETDEEWTLDHAVTLLLDAMEWMKLRAVAPEDLGDYGHTIPTAFSNDELHVEALPEPDPEEAS